MNRRDSRHGFETRFCLSARSVAAATLTFYVADPLQSGKGYQTVQFYQLDGNTWRKLDSLESHAATTGPLDRSMANQKNRVKRKLKLPPGDSDWPIMSSWEVRKWIDSSTVLLYAH